MKKVLFLCILSLIFTLSACEQDSGRSDSSSVPDYTGDIAAEEAELSRQNNHTYEPQGEIIPEDANQEKEETISDPNELDKMIIYTADLSVEVRDYHLAIENITSKTVEFSGYVAESNMYEETHNNSINGYVTVRIPQEKFREFIGLVEEGSSKVVILKLASFANFPFSTTSFVMVVISFSSLNNLLLPNSRDGLLLKQDH